MKSSELYSRAVKLMPGGVSSPVRAIKPHPFYTLSGKGARIRTADGKELIDCCMAYGPLLLGHAHPGIQAAIRSQLAKGWLFGTPSPLEPEMAGLVRGDYPSMEMVRFVSSGSEATMSAIRVARGFTGKSDIVKVEGGFHGAHDAVLVKAGSGATTLGLPDSAGVLPDLTRHTHQVPYNDPHALEDILAGHGDVAAFILEPVLGNIGPVLPDENYLREVRSITRDHDVLLIFDEVITGYRLGKGGAQGLYGIRPDLTTLGKVLGGGLPIGAFGGRREIMDFVAPCGPVYQAGTFSGNPLSLAAGIATIRYLHDHGDIYRRLDDMGKAIAEAVKVSGGKGSFVRLGSMFKYFFREKTPRNYREAKESDIAAFTGFWTKMLSRGIFLPPSQYETNFLSAAHTDEEIEAIARGYRECLS
ncbi:MAG: glutamate-1-semialdehyde 2,1-aminomutase [Methanomicrobiales archaeon]|nr:glutamate-1-semialdehyde 2,1-aminomutase [Methanomicrobiales archaeon]